MQSDHHLPVKGFQGIRAKVKGHRAKEISNINMSTCVEFPG